MIEILEAAWSGRGYPGCVDAKVLTSHRVVGGAGMVTFPEAG